MARAVLILSEKVVNGDGDITELVVWRLPSRGSARGIKYRLAFIRRYEARPAVLYDNHSPKGDHRHIEGVEHPYRFVDLEHLLEDF